jgi:cell fate regulator YaaT (PSP1 superfamily)
MDVVGVRFKKAGKAYDFDVAGIELIAGDHVVVKTARGSELGQVVTPPRQIAEADINTEIKPVLRKAEPDDIEKSKEYEVKETEATAECAKLIAKLGLPMKLLGSEYGFNGSRLTFFFSSAERVDFRDLVRELNSKFKTKVELRQLGPRDETKLIGGFGRCGRPLCCMDFLTEFNPVSIRMAKEQDLPLNPMKISGVCGRLLCCLAYESEQYKAMKKKLPRPGQDVNTPNGPARVVGTNPLKETVMVELESQARVELTLDKITPREARSPAETPASLPPPTAPAPATETPEERRNQPGTRTGFNNQRPPREESKNRPPSRNDFRGRRPRRDMPRTPEKVKDTAKEQPGKEEPKPPLLIEGAPQKLQLPSQPPVETPPAVAGPTSPPPTPTP